MHNNHDQFSKTLDVYVSPIEPKKQRSLYDTNPNNARIVKGNPPSKTMTNIYICIKFDDLQKWVPITMTPETDSKIQHKNMLDINFSSLKTDYTPEN